MARASATVLLFVASCCARSLPVNITLPLPSLMGHSGGVLMPRRRLSPEDFRTINELLSRVSVTLPDMQANAIGIDMTLSDLTCSGFALSEITLTTQAIDSATFDMRPRVVGVNATCSALWGYYVSALFIRGGGAISIRATNALLAAVIPIKHAKGF